MRKYNFMGAFRISTIVWSLLWLVAINHCALDSCLTVAPATAQGNCCSHEGADSSSHCKGGPCGIVQSAETAPLKIYSLVIEDFAPLIWAIDLLALPVVEQFAPSVADTVSPPERLLFSLSIASNAPPATL